MLEINGLKKSFDNRVVIDDLNFTASEGEVTGIFGVKNAGKTVLLKLIMGILKPDSGKIVIDNKELSKNVYKDVAFVTDKRGLFYDMNPIEHMEYMRYYYPRFSEDIFKQYIEFFQIPMKARLEKLKDDEVEKVDMALALAKNTKYLILDEPFKGAVPKDRKLFIRTMLSTMRKDGIVLIAARNSQGMKDIVDKALILEK